MSLKLWKCKVCKEAVESFEKVPQHCGEPMQTCFKVPNAKFMEPRAPGQKSVLKNQNKILKARSREHARDFELDELIASNSQDLAKKNQWITDQGRKRKKIDDI